MIVIAPVEGSGTPENVWMLASIESPPSKKKTCPASPGVRPNVGATPTAARSVAGQSTRDQKPTESANVSFLRVTIAEDVVDFVWNGMECEAKEEGLVYRLNFFIGNPRPGKRVLRGTVDERAKIGNRCRGRTIQAHLDLTAVHIKAALEIVNAECGASVASAKPKRHR
jgi:hypothetical protein